MCRPNRDQFYTYKISDSFCICSIRAECGKMALLNSSCHWVSGLRRTCSFQSVSQSVSNLVSHHQLPPRHPTSTWVLPYLKSSSILHNAVVQNIIDQVDKVQLRVTFQPEAAGHCYSQLSLFFFWPRRLCVRHTRWRLQCEAGHCYYHRSVFFFFGPGSLRAPCVFACAIRSLVIVITIVQSLLAQAACVRHTCLRAPCVAWPLLLPLLSLSFFLSFLFFSLRLLLFTHFRESPVCENLFPPIFWHN